MGFTSRDYGYTIASRFEESVRHWLRNRLLAVYGNEWRSQLPTGIWTKVADKIDVGPTTDPLDVLDETDFLDLSEITCYRKAYEQLCDARTLPVEEFQAGFIRIYDLRNRIAHVKRHFTKTDLLLLITEVEPFLPVLDGYDAELRAALAAEQVVQVPPAFLVEERRAAVSIPHNLPPGDYYADGGFIGRREDLSKLEKHLRANLDRVITIVGAGGVGKTALAHRLCESILERPQPKFDAIVWVSAKEERLALTGIQAVDSTLRSYQDLLDTILETFGWLDDLDKPIDARIESVQTILQLAENGLLIVVDNLETVQDQRIIDFIKDLPLPNKALLTSRVGLGEIERRYQLKALDLKEAVTLFRSVAREKTLDDLASLPETILTAYVEKMFRYPLVIKWVLGQAALGRDLNHVLVELSSRESDVARFCFEHIFDRRLDNSERLLLFALSTQDHAMTKGLLCHLSNLSIESVDSAIQNLTRASLVVSVHHKTDAGAVETRYELLPLTRNYVFSRLQSCPAVLQEIKGRMTLVRNLLDEGERAGKEYKYSLRDLGATSEEEKVAATWAMIAHQKFEAGDYASAVTMFEKAVRICPTLPMVYRNWAKMEITAGFYERALDRIKVAVDQAPNDVRVWREWASIEMKAQRYDSASEKLSRALALEPEDAFLLQLQGEVEKRRGNYEEADRLLRHALQRASQTGLSARQQVITKTSLASTLRNWADGFAKSGRVDMSMAKLHEAYALAKDVFEQDRSEAARSTLGEVAFDLGNLYLRQGDRERSLTYLKQAVNFAPSKEHDRRISSLACFHITDELLRAGEREEARPYFSAALQLARPHYPISRFLPDLALEFTTERRVAVLSTVVAGRGYGFLGERPNCVFLHMSNLVPPVQSSAQFELLEGQLMSYLPAIQEDGRVQAKRAIMLDRRTVLAVPKLRT